MLFRSSWLYWKAPRTVCATSQFSVSARQGCCHLEPHLLQASISFLAFSLLHPDFLGYLYILDFIFVSQAPEWLGSSMVSPVGQQFSSQKPEKPVPGTVWILMWLRVCLVLLSFFTLNLDEQQLGCQPMISVLPPTIFLTAFSLE